jgi:hypothetical protein
MLDETARTIMLNLGSIGSIESRLRALASAPAFVAEIERQARDVADAHRAAIERLRAAEQKFIEVGAQHEAKLQAAEAVFGPVRDRYLKAREEHDAARNAADFEYRRAQDEAQRALAAIAELPPWRAFELWRQRIDETLSHTFLDHGPPPVQYAFGHPAPFEKQTAEWRERATARRTRVDALTRGFRATVAAARTTFCSEAEAIEGCRAALHPLRLELSLRPGSNWPA